MCAIPNATQAPFMRHHSLAILCACLMLAACGPDKTATPTQQVGEEGLPQPETAGGSVTGMPNPGTPSVQRQPAADPAVDVEDPGDGTEGGDAVNPGLPVAPPAMTADGTTAKPPADAMPAMPAPPPAANDPSPVASPPQS